LGQLFVTFFFEVTMGNSFLPRASFHYSPSTCRRPGPPSCAGYGRWIWYRSRGGIGARRPGHPRHRLVPHSNRGAL